MKVFENGICRDMTAAEIAAMQAAQMGSDVPEGLTNEKKLELMLASIPEEPKPSVAPKVGYKWQPMYTASAGFAWELVEDQNALGTQTNPLYWIADMAVKTGYHYTDGVTTYVALADGVPSGFNDATFFAEV